MKLRPFSDHQRGVFVSIDGPIGLLCRELTETTTGHALACLYAADRYHHLEAEVRPNTNAGRVVISDRYIPSALVMQRFDGIDPAFLWQLNASAQPLSALTR
jgi:dTMP kinase